MLHESSWSLTRNLTQGKSLKLSLSQQDELIYSHSVSISRIAIMLLNFSNVLIEDQGSIGILEVESKPRAIERHPIIKSCHVARGNECASSAVLALSIAVILSWVVGGIVGGLILRGISRVGGVCSVVGVIKRDGVSADHRHDLFKGESNQEYP